MPMAPISSNASEGRRRRRRPLSEEELADLRALFERGVPSRVLAQKFGCAGGAVIRNIARERGWRRPEGFEAARRAAARWHPTREQAAWLRAHWNAGPTMLEMMAHLNVSRNAIERAARRLGLPPRDRRAVLDARRASSTRRAFVLSLWNAGVDTDTICIEAGKSPASVRAIIRNARARGEEVARRLSPKPCAMPVSAPSRAEMQGFSSP